MGRVVSCWETIFGTSLCLFGCMWVYGYLWEIIWVFFWGSAFFQQFQTNGCGLEKWLKKRQPKQAHCKSYGGHA